jgi:hypothetical protein
MQAVIEGPMLWRPGGLGGGVGECFADNHLRDERRKNDAREYKNEERTGGKYDKKIRRSHEYWPQGPELFAAKELGASAERVGPLVLYPRVAYRTMDVRSSRDNMSLSVLIV